MVFIPLGESAARRSKCRHLKPADSVTGAIAYRIRDGKHNVTAFDWDQYLTFAETQRR
jgi:hypothetical protein